MSYIYGYLQEYIELAVIIIHAVVVIWMFLRTVAIIRISMHGSDSRHGSDCTRGSVFY